MNTPLVPFADITSGINTYRFSPISRKIGRILGERGPKSKEIQYSIAASHRNMNTVRQRILDGKKIGRAPEWMHAIQAYGTPERSEKRGRLTVGHIEGITLNDIKLQMGMENIMYILTYEELLNNVLNDIRGYLTGLNILWHDLHRRNIMADHETAEFIIAALREKRMIFLRSDHKLWVNFDPEGFQIQDLPA